ncbi:hypothetical protein THAOC_23975, partial [Thalassiosira oceanica]
PEGASWTPPQDFDFWGGISPDRLLQPPLSSPLGGTRRDPTHFKQTDHQVGQPDSSRPAVPTESSSTSSPHAALTGDSRFDPKPWSSIKMGAVCFDWLVAAVSAMGGREMSCLNHGRAANLKVCPSTATHSHVRNQNLVGRLGATYWASVPYVSISSVVSLLVARHKESASDSSAVKCKSLQSKRRRGAGPTDSSVRTSCDRAVVASTLQVDRAFKCIPDFSKGRFQKYQTQNYPHARCPVAVVAASRPAPEIDSRSGETSRSPGPVGVGAELTAHNFVSGCRGGDDNISTVANGSAFLDSVTQWL